jgi:outer membrane protein TolC
MTKTIFGIFCPLLLFGYTIDFDTSLEKTIQNNKGLKAKKLDIEEAKLGIEEAKGYNYGKIVFNENISRTNNAGYVFGMKMASREAQMSDFGFTTANFVQMQTAMGAGQEIGGTQPDALNNPDARTNFETKVKYEAPIFTGYKLQNAKKMAKLQLLAKKALYSYDEKALSLEVLKAYNGAVAAKEFIKATKKAKEATSSFVNFATELYNEGLVTSIDVKQATVYDLDVDAKMIEAKNRYELALSYLRFLTNDSKITDVGEFKSIQYDTTSLQDMQQKAQEQREDLSWMKYNTQTMKTKIAFDSAEKYPMVGAMLEYGYNDDSANNIKSDKDYYLGAVGLSYTIFDGKITKTKEQKAKIQYNKTQYYFNYMKDGVKLEVEKNLLTLKTKQKILAQKIKAQSLSDEVLEQSSEMYKNHLINMSNLLMQQANQQKAQAQTILAKYELSVAAGNLKISLGEKLK